MSTPSESPKKASKFLPKKPPHEHLLGIFTSCKADPIPNADIFTVKHKDEFLHVDAKEAPRDYVSIRRYCEEVTAALETSVDHDWVAALLLSPVFGLTVYVGGERPGALKFLAEYNPAIRFYQTHSTKMRDFIGDVFGEKPQTLESYNSLIQNLLQRQKLSCVFVDAKMSMLFISVLALGSNAVVVVTQQDSHLIRYYSGLFREAYLTTIGGITYFVGIHLEKDITSAKASLLAKLSTYDTDTHKAKPIRGDFSVYFGSLNFAEADWVMLAKSRVTKLPPKNVV